jgi:hypothetical protein
MHAATTCRSTHTDAACGCYSAHLHILTGWQCVAATQLHTDDKTYSNVVDCNHNACSCHKQGLYCECHVRLLLHTYAHQTDAVLQQELVGRHNAERTLLPPSPT